MSSPQTRVPKDVRGILFDLDGVLAKLHVLVHTALSLAEAFGGSLTAAAFRADLAGGQVRCLWRYIATYLGGQGICISWEAVRDREAELYFGRNGQSGLVAAEALLIDRALLHGLRERFTLGVVTSRPRDRAFAFFTQVGIDPQSFFAVIVTRDDVGDECIKPHRRPVELGVAGLGSSRAGTVLFLDDSPSGITAGRGLTFTVGVADPEFRSAKTLRDAGADCVWEHPDELRMLLGVR